VFGSLHWSEDGARPNPTSKIKMCWWYQWIYFIFPDENMAEYVVPMMTRGISQHWETMAGAMGETAVYASLQITLYIARLLSDPFLTGFPVTNEKQTGGLFWETADNDLANFGHAQYSFDTGYCICAILLFMNIMTAVGVRQQSSKRVSL